MNVPTLSSHLGLLKTAPIALRTRVDSLLHVTRLGVVRKELTRAARGWAHAFWRTEHLYALADYAGVRGWLDPQMSGRTDGPPWMDEPTAESAIAIHV